MKEWTEKEFQELRSAVIRWFQTMGRVLPWRLTRDPYRIWISEIMLQQTQVATVIPYFERFLQEFPTVVHLADAPEDRVLYHWAGLGYYRRARQLHLAAKVIAEKHNGTFPEPFDEVLALPGIGRYTAGAICSFAYDQRTPIVEANTQRLYARLLRWKSPLSLQTSQKSLWQFAESVLPPETKKTSQKGSGQLNQALMELGSQVCTPKNPACTTCPLNQLCPTFEKGEQGVIPAPKPPKAYEERTEAALLICNRSGDYLMRRCEEGERWAGLWDFPRFDVTHAKQEEHITRSLEEQFQSKYACGINAHQETLQFQHGVTRFRITLKCYVASLKKPVQKQLLRSLSWNSLEAIGSLPLSSTGKKIYQSILANAKTHRLPAPSMD